MTWSLPRVSPIQNTVARSGVKARLTSSLKSSAVPVLAATIRSGQWSPELGPKIRLRLKLSDMTCAVTKVTPGSTACLRLVSGFDW